MTHIETKKGGSGARRCRQPCLAWLYGIQTKGTKPLVLCEAPPLPDPMSIKHTFAWHNNTRPFITDFVMYFYPIT